MPPDQPVNETIILFPKEGVSLSNTLSSASASEISLVQVFVRLTNMLKGQQGFIRQFWGHEVENPNIFVWSIDWESYKHVTAFTNSEKYQFFMADVNQVFDLEKAAPLRLYTSFTMWDPVAAFEAPVTEVAFFTLLDGTDEATKATVEDGSLSTLEAVTKVGKASGASIGWVFDAKPYTAAGPQRGREWLCGVFGYASIKDHMQWRQTPEHAEVVSAPGPDMEPAAVPGIDPSTGYFHVKFQAGM